MAFVRLTTLAHAQRWRDQLIAEITKYDADNNLQLGNAKYLDPDRLVPGLNSIAADFASTNVIAFADTTEPRIVVKGHREGVSPNVMWWIDHIWGPSAIHDKILLRLCNGAIALGFGPQKVRFRTLGDANDLPVVKVAIAKFVTANQRSADGTFYETTFSAAAARGTANGVTP